jgi:hypothetical protein
MAVILALAKMRLEDPMFRAKVWHYAISCLRERENNVSHTVFFD